MYCAECGEKISEKYEDLADQIYDMLEENDPTFGDIIGALELVKLWITTDFIDMHNENKEEN